MNFFSKKIVFFVIILSLLSFLTVVFASPTEVNIKADQTIYTDFYTSGVMVNSLGNIKGDFIGVSQKTDVNGVVEGDFIFAAQNITLNAAVGGDVRTASQIFNLNSKVGKNITSFSQTAYIDSSSVIEGNVILFCQEAKINGTFNKNLTIYAQSVDFNGKVLGDVNIYIGEAGKLNILSDSKVNGDLNYSSSTKANIPQNSALSNVNWSKTTYEDVVTEKVNNKPSTEYIFDIIQIIVHTAFYFLLGFIFIKLFPKSKAIEKESINKNPVKTFFKGILVLVSSFAVVIMTILLLLLHNIVPVEFTFVILLFFTGVYMFIIYLSTIPCAIVLGKFLFKQKFNIYVRFALGLCIIVAIQYVFNLLSESMFIFGVLNFLLTMFIISLGLGAKITSITSALKELLESQKIIYIEKNEL